MEDSVDLCAVERRAVVGHWWIVVAIPVIPIAFLIHRIAVKQQLVVPIPPVFVALCWPARIPEVDAGALVAKRSEPIAQPHRQVDVDQNIQ